MKSGSVKQKCRNKYCKDGHEYLGFGEYGPCPECSDPELYRKWDEARERHAENCAGADGLPPGHPC